jgi:hypothetical protein
MFIVNKKTTSLKINDIQTYSNRNKNTLPMSAQKSGAAELKFRVGRRSTLEAKWRALVPLLFASLNFHLECISSAGKDGRETILPKSPRSVYIRSHIIRRRLVFLFRLRHREFARGILCLQRERWSENSACLNTAALQMFYRLEPQPNGCVGV